VLSKTTPLVPCLNSIEELELAVCDFMRTKDPKLALKAPLSNIVVPLEIIPMIKPPSD
jgi:hypothetical protein